MIVWYVSQMLLTRWITRDCQKKNWNCCSICNTFVVVDDVCKGVDNRFIGLNASFNVLKKRICKQGRNGEDKYKIEQLKMYPKQQIIICYMKNWNKKM